MPDIFFLAFSPSFTLSLSVFLSVCISFLSVLLCVSVSPSLFSFCLSFFLSVSLPPLSPSRSVSRIRSERHQKGVIKDEIHYFHQNSNEYKVHQKGSATVKHGKWIIRSIIINRPNRHNYVHIYRPTLNGSFFHLPIPLPTSNANSWRSFSAVNISTYTCVYWKGINAHMECTVKACSVLQTNQSSQQAETHRPLDNPDGLWQVLATNLFHLDGNDYVIVIDYYLNIPFLRRLTSNSTSATVISAVKQLFGEHGIPHKLLSDNGPQYDYVEFRTFAADWGFKHVSSSPRYPSPTDLPNVWSRLSRKPCSRQGRAVLIHTSLCCLRNHPHRQQPPLLCRTPLLLAAQIQLPSTLLPHTPRYSCPQEPARPSADAKVVPWLERPWPSTTPTLANMSTCRKGWCCREEAPTAFVHRLHSKRWSLTVVIVASSGTWQHHPNISHGQTRPASTTHPHRTSNNR